MLNTLIDSSAKLIHDGFKRKPITVVTFTLAASMLWPLLSPRLGIVSPLSSGLFMGSKLSELHVVASLLVATFVCFYCSLRRVNDERLKSKALVVPGVFFQSKARATVLLIMNASIVAVGAIFMALHLNDRIVQVLAVLMLVVVAGILYEMGPRHKVVIDAVRKENRMFDDMV